MSRFAAWPLVLLLTLVPLGIAANSPLLAWREPVYIVAGFAGVVGLALLLIQPLLILNALPGLSAMRTRKLHRLVGVALLVAVLVHVGGLWVTSPPDVVDALLLRSPTLFSVWGVAAMWAVFATAALAFYRRKLGPRRWRLAHVSLAVVIVLGTTIHALLIEGTMGTVSKAVLCLAVLSSALAVIRRRR